LISETPNLVNVTSSDNNDTALHISISHGDVKIVALLLELNSNVNAVNNLGQTAVQIAVSHKNNTEMIELLLRYGADICAIDFDKYDIDTTEIEVGQTALHIASIVPNNAINIKMLMAARSDIEARDYYGRTALHLACDLRNNTENVLTLLEAGSDFNTTDNDDRTALDHAKSIPGNERTIEILTADILDRVKLETMNSF